MDHTRMEKNGMQVVERDLPHVDMTREKPEKACLRLLKEVFARVYVSIPLRIMDGGVLVAMAEPNRKDVVNALRFHMGMPVYPAQAEKSSILRAIDKYYTDNSKGNQNIMEEQLGPTSHTISVISNKGGVGKTHMSTNIAKVIADTGRRVLLVDADLGNADISNKLAFFPENTLYDFFQGDTGIKEVIKRTPYGFDLIAGTSGEFKLANLNYVQRSKFIRNFRKVSQKYDFTIFDLSAGISTVVLDFALATDEIVVITTPQDIIAGYACIKASFQRFKTIEEKLMNKVEDYKPQKIYTPWIVMNQLTDLKQGVFLYNRICQTIDEKINNQEDIFTLNPAYLGGILYDRELFRKVESLHKPLITSYPKAKVSQCMTYLANNLVRPPEQRDTKQELKGFRRFSLIFGLK
ncbi:MAG: hypothetical protein DRG37_08105 [Deltaproteobacteria bacterium]|nr:MAG: hypothetical protein DRG37_08105 [Deltaproteobacteria bacterium]